MEIRILSVNAWLVTEILIIDMDFGSGLAFDYVTVISNIEILEKLMALLHLI